MERSEAALRYLWLAKREEGELETRGVEGRGIELQEVGRGRV